jgi:hypothetical protein
MNSKSRLDHRHCGSDALSNLTLPDRERQALSMYTADQTGFSLQSKRARANTRTRVTGFTRHGIQRILPLQIVQALVHKAGASPPTQDCHNSACAVRFRWSSPMGV